MDRPRIGTRIAAVSGDSEPAEVMGPASRVRGACFSVRQPGMGHAQKRAAILLDEVDLDQARSRRNGLIALPAEAVGEPVDRHDLAEGAAGAAPADRP